MQRRLGLAGGLALSALALAACNPAKIGEHRNERSLVVNARLDCPEDQGELVRRSMAADGRSCGYTGQNGEEVALELVALNGRSPQAVLTGLEAELKQSAPQPVATPQTPEAAKADPDPDSEDGPQDGERTKVDLPGLHIDAKGEKAVVSLPGVHINADNGKAEVQVDKPGGKLFSVHADENGAEVRSDNTTARNVNATYVLASKAPGGDDGSAVGYVVRGPVSGPLVVAKVKGRGFDDHDGEHVMKSVRRLVAQNVHRAKRI